MENTLPWSPLKFPTMEDLLAIELQTPPPEDRTGLFYALLGDSPLPIYHDAQEHPEKYTEEDKELLTRTVSRGPAPQEGTNRKAERWLLSDEERRHFDQMTLTFATADRIKPPLVLRPSPAPRRKRAEAVDIEKLATFWWLKKEAP